MFIQLIIYSRTCYLKELRIQQAEQRLARRSTPLKGILLPDDSVLKTKASFNNYRDPQVDFLIEGRKQAREEKEVLDPTITEKATGGISYSVYK